MKRNGWVPLQRADWVRRPQSDAGVELLMARIGVSREEALRQLEHEASQVEYWVNDVYQVGKRKLPVGHPWNHTQYEMIHLNIRRRDGKPIFRDWRHFQRIKNELAGEECEALELYPAESRLSDTSNKFHLWCMPSGVTAPFGMHGRDVMDDDGDRTPGFRQRKLP
jgi:hypothetical protein